MGSDNVDKSAQSVLALLELWENGECLPSGYVFNAAHAPSGHHPTVGKRLISNDDYNNVATALETLRKALECLSTRWSQDEEPVLSTKQYWLLATTITRLFPYNWSRAIRRARVSHMTRGYKPIRLRTPTSVWNGIFTDCSTPGSPSPNEDDNNLNELTLLVKVLASIWKHRKDLRPNSTYGLQVLEPKNISNARIRLPTGIYTFLNLLHMAWAILGDVHSTKSNASPLDADQLQRIAEIVPRIISPSLGAAIRKLCGKYKDHTTSKEPAGKWVVSTRVARWKPSRLGRRSRKNARIRS